MNVFVYRSGKKNTWYLYVPGEGNFEQVPEQLLATLGPLEMALQFDLHPERKLARDNAAQVIADLEEKGYHLQIGDPMIADPLVRRH
jgi:uncharacterized protein YcgL (UPF0745 family)